MTGPALALIDGNSFYCSCERVFDAKLKKKPVIVLSNNEVDFHAPGSGELGELLGQVLAGVCNDNFGVRLTTTEMAGCQVSFRNR